MALLEGINWEDFFSSTPVWTNDSTEPFVFLCLNIYYCVVKYLFFCVIFLSLGGLQLTIVPDRPHWESNGRRKERQEATGKTGGGYGF